MRGKLLFTVVAACALGLVTLAAAQSASMAVQPTRTLTVTSTERTPEMMDAFEATSVAPAAKAAPFRPTMGVEAYRALKQQAAKLASAGRQGTSSPGSFAPPVMGTQFNGPSQCNGSGTCWFPPDVAASAVTNNDIIAVHNNMFAVYSNTGTQLRLISLNAFFGYSAQPFFDPRVVYDSVWSRFCVTAAAFPTPNTASQIYGIACSVNQNPLGSWHVYLPDVGGFGQGVNGFYDFPMVGDSQDAVLFTANLFSTTSYLGSSLFAVGKHALFNGRGFSIPVYTGLQGTLQPARELLDGNGYAWLAAANTSGNVAMYALGYPASPPDTHLLGPYNVAVTAYSVPPGATQPTCGGGTNALDTSDTRFVNMGIQNGDLYYQAHSILDGTATGRYYIISGLLTFLPVVKESGTFWTTSTSSDFNVSVAADGGNRMVLNWSSVDAGTSSYNPAIRFTGKLPTDGVISGPVGTTAYVSPACLTGNYDSNFGLQRWGDYSQSTSDPGVSGQFWIDNETVPTTSSWGTVITAVHF
jgi:hypothetical protein